MDDAKTVAKWLYDKIMAGNYTYQETVVYEIKKIYGDQYTYTNINGNLAIGKDVLKEFGKLKGDDIVWDRSERAWHKTTSTYGELSDSNALLAEVKLADIELTEFEPLVLEAMPEVELTEFDDPLLDDK